MPDPDATGFADAPIDLLCLWNQYALCGLLDSHNPPATAQEAYNQVLPLHLKDMREPAEEINDDVQRLRELDGSRPPTCCMCGASPLTSYMASLYNGATYCQECAEWK